MATISIKLNDGTIIENVPEGITKSQLMQKLQGTSVAQEVARPFLRTGKSIAAGVIGGPVDLANMVLSAPGQAASALGFEDVGQTITPSQPPFMGSEYIRSGVDKLTGGLTKPRGATERILQDVEEGVSSLGTGVGLLNKAKAVYPSMESPLSSMPAELGATVVGTGAASTAGEAGLPGYMQALFGLIGGVGGGKAGAKLTKSGQTQPLLQDLAESGIEEGRALPSLVGKVRGRYEKEAKRMGELFQEAEARGANASIPGEEIADLRNHFIRLSKDEFGQSKRAVYADMASRLDPGKPMTLNQLEEIRRSASQSSRVVSDEGFASGNVARTIDDYLLGKGRFESRGAAKIDGDSGAVGTWKEAIKSRRDIANKFEEPEGVKIAIEDNDIKKVETALIGSGSPGNKGNLAVVYRNVIKSVPDGDKKEVAMLMRQSIISRMIKSSARTAKNDGIDARIMANQIRNLRRENPDMWNSFPRAEKRLLTNLERGLREETKAGALKKVAGFISKYIGRTPLYELPSTLDPKRILSVDELIKLSETPLKKPIVGISIGTTGGE